jgi:hypothetical protein
MATVGTQHASPLRAVAIALALILVGCSQAADVPDARQIDSEDLFVSQCRPSHPMIVSGLWRGTFEKGDFVFTDALKFASDPGPFAFNPAAKHIALEAPENRHDRALLDRAPRNGVAGWSYVWRVKLLVTSPDCAGHLQVRRVLELQNVTPTEYRDSFEPGRVPDL